jgi:SPP1 gp7 family putative phage head morphogenesis protein
VPKALTSALDQNIFVFSGLKTYHQLRQASQLLIDEKGNIKPFSRFEQEITSLYQTYNVRYLEAEYNFAGAAAQMAAKWSDFEQDGDEYNLQFRTSGDEKVRASHAELHNTTLPASDPFWDSYMPPLDWNCRCTVVQVLKNKYPVSNSAQAVAKGETATTRIDKNGVNRAAMFRFNPGKQKVIFPENHPYFKVQQGVMDIVGALQTAPVITKSIKFESEGVIDIYRHVNTNNADHKDVMACCTHFAKQGNKTEVLPKLHPNSEEYKRIYADLIGTKYEGKSPDFRVNGKYYELEGFVGKPSKNSLSNMLSRGAKQSNRIVIKDDGSNNNYLKRRIIDRVNKGQNIKEVWRLKESGELERVYKSENPS